MHCQDTFALTTLNPSTVKPHRRHAVRQVVVAVVMLVPTACGQTDSVPAETSEGAPVDLQASPTSPESPESADDWCVDGDEKMMGFRLENGKTVSICEAAGSSELIYAYGVLGEEPELVYRGPRLGSFEGLSGFSYDIASLASGFETEFSGPDVSVSASPEAVSAAESGPDSRGFFYVHSRGCCGGEEEAYLFKRGGWEYAVRSGYSRNHGDDELIERIGHYTPWEVITVTSPDGEDIIIE